MANIIDAFQPEGGINLDDILGIFAGSTNPSVVGEVAPIGSLWIRSNGQLFQKIGAGNTDWIVFAQGIGEAVKISATDTNAGFLNLKLLVSTSLTKTVNNIGANETLTLDLANVGTPGTYRSVTTNAKGQVTAGTNPTTLSGYGITDAQPLATNLTNLAAQAGVGFYVRQTVGGTTTTRTIVGTTNQISVLAGDGASGNPTLSFPTTTLFPGTTGLRPPSGTTAQRVATAPYLRFNTSTTRMEYFNGTVWVELVASTGGTVTSVQIAQPSFGITVTGGPITTSGTFTVALANDLAAIESLTGVGASFRTDVDTWALRSFVGTADRITVVDGTGVAGNPTFDIASTYVGQPSITTLGVVNTGTWQATTISTQFGGTGRTSIGSSNQVLAVNNTASGLEYKSIIGGTGITVSPSAGQFLITNNGVLSITGTANQVIASAATGAVTLSLPQSIATTSSPTFAQVTVAANPTLPLHVATKQYVDSAIEGVDHKQSVRVATTANITLSGLQTIDGVALSGGDRVLVKDQSVTTANGIYLASAGAWSRSFDMDAWSEVPSAYTFVEEGTTLSDTAWVSTADQNGALGTTPVTWVQFSSASSIIAGTGLTRTGNTFSITNVGTAGSYNNVTTNAQGQVVAGSTVAYLTGNQNITLIGDVTGVGTTLITTTLPSITAAGTFTSVTVNAKGQVTAGSNPTTLAGYGILDAQPLDADLTALASFTGTGFTVRTGTNSWEQRVITAGSSKLSVANGDGVAGNVVLDVVEANLALNQISGVLDISKGGTNLTALGTADQFLSVNPGGTALEYKSIVAGTGITVVPAAGQLTISAVNNGTVTSIAVTGSTGLTVGGSPITSSGTITLTLGPELQGLSTQSGLGFVARTATGTYTQRSIVSGAGTIDITNPAGTNGNVGIDLENIGTSGTYYQVTTDNFGRVLSGATSVPWSVITSTPITLSGYGIIDAQPLSSFLTSVASNANTGIVVKNGASSIIRTIVAGSAKISVTNGSGVAGNPSIDLGSVALGDLSNVSVASPVTGQSLVYNGSVWTAASVTPKLYAENAVAEVTPVSTGTNAIALGSAATAGAHDSLAFGPQSLSRHPGIVQANGRFASQGDAQAGTYILRTGTINAVPTELFLDGTNGSERLVMSTDTTWVFKISIVGHRTDADDHAGFKVDGVVYCGASLNSIALLGAPTKIILARSQGNWNVSVSADTINGSLRITATGAAGQTIRWTAVVETVEVTN